MRIVTCKLDLRDNYIPLIVSLDANKKWLCMGSVGLYHHVCWITTLLSVYYPNVSGRSAMLCKTSSRSNRETTSFPPNHTWQWIIRAFKGTNWQTPVACTQVRGSFFSALAPWMVSSHHSEYPNCWQIHDTIGRKSRIFLGHPIRIAGHSSLNLC